MLSRSPRLDSSWCAERSRPCFGVSVEPGGRRATFGLCCVKATVPVEVVAGADGCAGADAGTEVVDGAEVGCGPSPICGLLAGGVTETYAGPPEKLSLVWDCLSLRCSFRSSSFFFCASVGAGCRACGGGDFGVGVGSVAGGDLSVTESSAAGSVNPAVACFGAG